MAVWKLSGHVTRSMVKMESRSLNSVMFLHLLVLCILSYSSADVLHLTEANWTDVLEGEWLVKFYAPWCPACRALESTWERLGQRSYELGMKFAKIDVTENAVLSGRFFIISLPTVYHVKDGEFRQYRGQRSEVDIVNFVKDDLWKELDPVPWYLSPTSVHMGAVGMFFRFSITIRDVHTVMTNEYGIPVWGSYIIFALATILLGLLIGLLIVFLCDAVHLTRSRRRSVRVHSRSSSTQLSSDSAVASSGSDADDVNEGDDDEDLPDDTRSGGDSAASAAKPSDEATQSAPVGESAPGLAAETGVRHRERPRKAD